MRFYNFKRSKKSFFPIFILALVFLAACADDSDCTTTSADVLRINFYKKVRINQQIPKEVDSITFTGITTVSLTDTIFYEGKKVPSVLLPINPLSDSIHYVFERSNRGKQNITIKYRNISRIIDTECGVERVITVTEVKSPELDSITVVKSILEKNDRVHVEIFL